MKKDQINEKDLNFKMVSASPLIVSSFIKNTVDRDILSFSSEIQFVALFGFFSLVSLYLPSLSFLKKKYSCFSFFSSVFLLLIACSTD